MQKKELFLWTFSTNQVNPPCVMARRLTGAHPQEVTKGKKSFLCWIWKEVAPAFSFMGLLPLALLPFPPPFSLLLDTSLPGIWGHSTPSPAPIAICSPQPHTARPQSLVHHRSTALCAILSPRLQLCRLPLAPFSSPGKARGGEGKGFPSSVQKCSSVSEDKACPLCNPPAAAATKAGRGGGLGAWGALCDPKGKTLRKEQNKYPLLPPLLNKRGQN